MAKRHKYVARGYPAHEFLSFESWLLCNRKVDEDLINHLVDNAYNEDTHTSSVVSEILSEYKRKPKKLSVNVADRAIRRLAKWCVQDTTHDDAKAVMKLAIPYAAEYSKWLVANWNMLLENEE